MALRTAQKETPLGLEFFARPDRKPHPLFFTTRRVLSLLQEERYASFGYALFSGGGDALMPLSSQLLGGHCSHERVQVVSETIQGRSISSSVSRVSVPHVLSVFVRDHCRWRQIPLVVPSGAAVFVLLR